ncbi:MAG: lysophospholipid acyltransferase family protein [Sphingomonas fennica]
MRLWARIAAALAWLAFCLAGYWIARPFGREGRWVRRFLGGVGRIAGLRIRIVGRPAPGPLLIAANHLSWLDILALGGTTGAAFVAKGEVARWPLVGTLARLGGTLFVEREARAETRRQADALGDALRRPRPAVLFAEGTTGDGTTLLPFRPALFAAAVAAGVPVQPVAIDYGADAAGVAWPEQEPFAANAARMLRRRRTRLTLRFLPPVAPGADRKALAAAARGAVAASLAAADRL